MMEHKEIWLQPWCDECASWADGRQWCEDELDECEDCGKPPVKYVIAEEKG